MAKKAVVAVEGMVTADEFGPSPFSFAETIEEQKEERARQRREELRKQRKMTNPHHAQNRQGRPDLLAVPPEYQESLKKRGLMAGWIRKEEWPEYRERGCQLATHQEIAACTGDGGALRHDSEKDGASSPTSAVERREMLLVVQPVKWQKDRLAVEQHVARSQMTDDPFDELKGTVQKGHFGSGARRPDALNFEDDDDD